jgi:hypothetical protein
MNIMSIQEAEGLRVASHERLNILADAQAETGSVDVGWLPFGAVFDLRQVRENYDLEELQLLADRIPYEVNDGIVHLKLQNPPVVNVFTERADLETYIADHAEYYDGDVSAINIDELPFVDGAWHVRINGHRRGRAIALRCEQLGIPEDQMRISYSFRRGISFSDAVQEQYVENTSSQIPPEQDARAIARHKKWLMTKGMNSSNAAIARFFGYGEEKVANALRFVTMPDSITNFLNDGLTYGNVIQLARLRDAYLRAERRTPADKTFADMMIEDPEIATELLSADDKMKSYFETMLLNRFKNMSGSRINEMIRAKIAEVNKQATYLTEELFLFDEIAEQRTARRTTRQGITGMALKALRYLDADGEQLQISPEDAELLLRLHLKATSAQDEVALQDLLDLGE